MSASIRQSFTDLCAYTESPVDERDFNGHRHTIPGAARSKYDHGNYDMEQYSELEGFHPSESEDEHDENDTHAKRQKLGNGGSRSLPYNTTVPFSRCEADIPIERQNININATGEEYGEEGGCHLETTIGMSGNSPIDERPQRRGRKPKNAAQKRGSRRTSLPMSPSDPNDQTEGDATGPQSLSGKGLRIYAQRVCDRVKAKGSTSYNELVHDLFGGNAGDDEDNVPEAAKQENIRRRVYDALNVLHAIDIIKFENKDICWVGAERSAEVRSVTESQTAMARAQDPPEDGGDEESEEPEYDDMDIEELQ
ncbi:Transcription factor dpl-1, partial [Mortierella sp. NVP85]